MSKSNSNTVVLLVLLFFSAPAFAGPYFGVEIGSNRADIGLGADRAAVASNAATFGAADNPSINSSESGTGFGVLVGYRLRNTALELSWTDLGDYSANLLAHGTETGGDPMQVRRQVDSDVSAVTLKLTQDFPLSGEFALVAQAGASWWHRDDDVRDTVTQFAPTGALCGANPCLSPVELLSASTRRSTRGTDPMAALGFRIGGASALTFLYGRYFDAAYGGGDINRISAVLSFGL